MKKMVVALGLLAAVALAAPARADADFSFAIGLPGFFGVFGAPPRPPLFYAPPAPYYAPPVVVYEPYYRPYYRPYYGYGYRGWDARHRGWRGHDYDRHGRYHR